MLNDAYTHTSMKRRIVVALSGGIDSAVAALLLREAGHEVIGVFMENWRKTAETPHCTTEEDRRDALRVAQHLGIPFHVVNYEREYREYVLNYFYGEYAAGRTPNPDMLCNSMIKFGPLLTFAKSFGAEALATGHYARVEKHNGQTILLRGIDRNKDQSYFLAQLSDKQLLYAEFPIGHLRKVEVRQIAKKANLPVADKPDSQGICFVGHVSIEALLRERIQQTPGDIRTGQRKYVGKHDGLPFYTIGQRHGLGVGGGVPYYVAAKEPATNTLIVAHGNRDAALYRTELLAHDSHWIGDGPTFPLRCTAMVRYRQDPQPAIVEKVGNNDLHVAFEIPQRAITPGQFVVFYDGERCLGSAVIE